MGAFGAAVSKFAQTVYKGDKWAKGIHSLNVYNLVNPAIWGQLPCLGWYWFKLRKVNIEPRKYILVYHDMYKKMRGQAPNILHMPLVVSFQYTNKRINESKGLVNT